MANREVRERILSETLTRPEGTTHKSTRRLARRVGVSASTVGRVWQEGRLKPHRSETFKFSRDPELVVVHQFEPGVVDSASPPA